MLYNIKVTIAGDFVSIGYVEADSEKAALEKLGLAKIPDGASLVEEKEIIGFDQLMARLEGSLGPEKFVIYCERHFKWAKKPSLGVLTINRSRWT